MKSILLFLALSPLLHAQEQAAKEKIIATYQYHDSTRLIVQSNEPLVIGKNVFVGAENIQVTVGDLLSKTLDLYYYRKSAPHLLNVLLTGKGSVTNSREDVIPSRPRRAYAHEKWISTSLKALDFVAPSVILKGR